MTIDFVFMTKWHGLCSRSQTKIHHFGFADMKKHTKETLGIITQHPAGHQDVEEGLGIATVVELGTREVEELCDRLQISASLIQTLHDSFLKVGRVKPLLFIC